MGQTESSNCVVEMASRSLSHPGFFSLYQPQENLNYLDRDDSCPWRIIINPSTEFIDVTVNQVVECDSMIATNIHPAPQSDSASLLTSPCSKVRGFSSAAFQNNLEKTCEKLYGVSKKLLTNHEAKCLVMLLEQKNRKNQLKTLASIGSLATCTANQELLCDFGVLEILKQLLLTDLTESARVLLTQCISTFSAQTTFRHVLQPCLPLFVRRLLMEDTSQMEKVVCTQALTNLTYSISSETELEQLASIAPYLLERLVSESVNLPVLKLLVNLSCITELVPVLSTCKSPLYLVDIFDCDCSVQVLRESTTFLFNLASAADTLDLSETNPIQNDNSAKDYSTVGEALFFSQLPTVSSKIQDLTNHMDLEISERSQRILPILLKWSLTEKKQKRN